MVRVSDVSDEEAPTVLIVDNNKMSLHRLTNLFRQREFQVEVCEDGDMAVDEENKNKEETPDEKRNFVL